MGDEDVPEKGPTVNTCRFVGHVTRAHLCHRPYGTNGQGRLPVAFPLKPGWRSAPDQVNDHAEQELESGPSQRLVSARKEHRQGQGGEVSHLRGPSAGCPARSQEPGVAGTPLPAQEEASEYVRRFPGTVPGGLVPFKFRHLYCQRQAMASVLEYFHLQGARILRTSRLLSMYCFRNIDPLELTGQPCSLVADV